MKPERTEISALFKRAVRALREHRDTDWAALWQPRAAGVPVHWYRWMRQNVSPEIAQIQITQTEAEHGADDPILVRQPGEPFPPTRRAVRITANVTVRDSANQVIAQGRIGLQRRNGAFKIRLMEMYANSAPGLE